MPAVGSTRSALTAIGVFVLVLITLSIADATCLGPWRRSKRWKASCASTLERFGAACLAYANAPLGPGGVPGYFPHVRDVDEQDRAEDVGDVFALLVRAGFVDDAMGFVCLESNDIPNRWRPGDDLSRYAFSESSVESSTEFSYGFTRWQVTVHDAPETMIAADRTARADSGSSWASGCHRDLAINHDGGRNVLRLDGSVEWVSIEAASEPAMGAALAGLNLAD